MPYISRSDGEKLTKNCIISKLYITNKCVSLLNVDFPTVHCECKDAIWSYALPPSSLSDSAPYNATYQSQIPTEEWHSEKQRAPDIHVAGGLEHSGELRFHLVQ